MINYKLIKLAICLYFVSMLSACITRKQSPFLLDKATNSEQSSPIAVINSSRQMFATIQQVREQEAKHAELPIPMNAVPIPELCMTEGENNEELVLAYKCSSSPKEIASFYNQQMEVLGWQEAARFEGHEVLLHYQKSDRWCTVSVRNTHSKHDPNMFIFMAPSKYSAV